MGVNKREVQGINCNLKATEIEANGDVLSEKSAVNSLSINSMNI